MTRMMRLIQLLVGVALIAGAGYAVVTQRSKLSQVGAHAEHGAELFHERLQAAQTLHEGGSLDPEIKVPRRGPSARQNRRAESRRR